MLPAASQRARKASASLDVVNRFIRPFSYTTRPFQYAIKRPSTIFSTLCVVFSVTLNLIGAFGGSSEVGLLSSSLKGASPFSLGALLRKPAIVAQHVQPDGRR